MIWDRSSRTDGSLWDLKSHDVTSFLVPGANTLRLTAAGGAHEATIRAHLAYAVTAEMSCRALDRAFT